MKKIKEKKCSECKKRLARYKCECGIEFCRLCSEGGEMCPRDEGIEHFVEPINPLT